MRHDFVSLQLFVAVAETGSISRGAQRAHLALAAASKRIAELESQVGTAILYRHARGVTLTPAGDALLHHARVVLQTLDRMTSDLSEYSHGVKGHVRVFANASAIIEFLPHDLSAFLAAHPHLRIDLEERSSGEIPRALLEGRTDVGIFDATAVSGALELADYRRDCLVLVTPRDHPLARRKRIAFRDALDYDVVGLHQGTALLNLIANAASEAGKPLKLRIQVRSFDAMCRMIEAGIGVGVLPEAAIGPQLAALELNRIALGDAWAARRHVVAVRSRSALPPPARLLVQHLTASLQ